MLLDQRHCTTGSGHPSEYARRLVPRSWVDGGCRNAICAYGADPLVRLIPRRSRSGGALHGDHVAVFRFGLELGPPRWAHLNQLIERR